MKSCRVNYIILVVLLDIIFLFSCHFGILSQSWVGDGVVPQDWLSRCMYGLFSLALPSISSSSILSSPIFWYHILNSKDSFKILFLLDVFVFFSLVQSQIVTNNLKIKLMKTFFYQKIIHRCTPEGQERREGRYIFICFFLMKMMILSTEYLVFLLRMTYLSSSPAKKPKKQSKISR